MSLDIFCMFLMFVGIGPMFTYTRQSKERICASLGLRMKFKTLFMSDHDLVLFFNMSNQFLAPGGLNAGCVKFNVM